MSQLSVEQSYKDAYMQRRERLGMAARPVQRVLVNRGTPEPLMIAPPRVARAPVVVKVVPPTPFEWAIGPVSVPVFDASNDMFALDGEFRVNKNWREIVREVCEVHRISKNDMLSKRRSKHIVKAKHEAFYRLRQETTLSLPTIGRLMGGYDHSSVLYGCRKHELILANNAASLAEFMAKHHTRAA